MITAQEVREQQDIKRQEQLKQKAEFESKYTYWENGEKKYYSTLTIEGIDCMIREAINKGQHSIFDTRRLLPEVVEELKKNGYRVFLDRYDTYDFVACADNCRKYKKVTYHNVACYAVWGEIPTFYDKVEEL